MTKRETNLTRKEALRQQNRAAAYHWQAVNASDTERAVAFQELSADAAEIARRMVERLIAA